MKKLIRMLKDGPKIFRQWDENRKLEVLDSRCTQVHFANANSELALVCPVVEEKGIRVVEVPNILLQEALELVAYLTQTDADGRTTLYTARFPVLARKQPENYVYTPTQVLRYEVLEQRLQELEKCTVRTINGIPADTQGNVQVRIPEAPAPDWNASEGEPGHVLNRTHWVDADGTVHKMDKMFLPDCIDGGALFGTTEKQVEVLPETDVQFYHDGYQYARKKTFENMPDKVKLPFPELSYGKYIVYWRDVPYECAVQCANGSNPDGSVWKRTTLGNVAGLKNTEFAGINMGIDSGEPFLIDTFFVYTRAGTISYITFYRFDDTDTEEFVPVQIFLCETAINKMPTKYLPDGVPCYIEGSATDTLTFDGNIEGREVLDLGEGMYFVKVSDAFVEGAELNGGTLTLVRLGEDASNETIVITEDMIMDVSSTFGFPAYVVGEFIYIMSQALTQDGMTLGKGIHFMCAPDEFYVSELKAPSAVIVSPGIVQTLDSRCLPVDATVFHLTSPNGTKYAITVGDSGAITATEVT